MLRPATLSLFALAPALFAACSSDEPSGAASAGSGSNDQGATGGTAGATSGSGPGSGAGGRSEAGGASTGGTSAGRSAGGQASAGGEPATGGATGGGAAGRISSTGGMTATGGAGAAGRSSTGGAASGGASASGSAGMGGAANDGGMSNGGAASAAGTAGTATSARCPDTTWKLTWGDDFEGASGSAVDGSKWTYDTGPNWYNGELQDYTSGTTNASLDGNGNLIIEARKEAREGREYTSARLKTEGKKTFTYGRFEGRMKLPYGQGMWPAFWMLGGNSWPNTGEIDIMENLGREPSIAHGTMHGPGYSGTAGPTASYTLPGDAKFSDDFHVFAIEWEANAIRWYVDDTLYSTKTPADISGKTWVFDHGFFFILNLAVGGEWPGNPDANTVFPQKLVIDYVRVCEK